MFSFLSFYALCLWAGNSRGQWIYSRSRGFFAGCAIGCKYTGAIPLAIGLLFLWMKHRAEPLSRLLRSELIYAATALFVFSPWLLKNIIYFGNPVFPFFYSWSIKRVESMDREGAAGIFSRFNGISTPRSADGILLTLIWDTAVHGLDFGGGMDVLGDLGWAPLFAFLPAVWLARKKPPMAVERHALYSTASASIFLGP